MLAWLGVDFFFFIPLSQTDEIIIIELLSEIHVWLVNRNILAWHDPFVSGFAGHGPCGKGTVGPSGTKNQLIRIPHCRWGFYINLFFGISVVKYPKKFWLRTLVI